jgi:hypothetical protein
VPQELIQIEKIIRHRILRADGPRGVAVPAQVRRDYVVAVSKRGGDEIPAPRVITTTVDQDQ